jgi:hypothetical protein
VSAAPAHFCFWALSAILSKDFCTILVNPVVSRFAITRPISASIILE